ncbi:MAG: recombination protein RecR [Bacteroidetes bacterium]|nr:recombination protein RecR [Bacteroidota bacterium]
MVNNFSSKLLETAVNELAKLPGIGKKSAVRLALHLLRQNTQEVESLGNALIKMRNEIIFCKNCFNISDTEICEICNNQNRDAGLICVVEDVRDVMAIENTAQFRGLYHVLGGVISPMDGIGPGDLNITPLLLRIEKQAIREIIMALSPTMEGDTTNFYIYKRLKNIKVLVTTIARGVSIGDNLEFTDEITLGRSIVNRLPYESTFNR